MRVYQAGFVLGGALAALVAGWALDARSVGGWWVCWLAGQSAAGFAAFWWDKRRAGSDGARVPERSLMLLIACGGATGAGLGLLLLRHKTRKGWFRWLIGASVVLHVVVAAVLLDSGV